MIKAILFDVDDTLIKTFDTKKEALKDIGRKFYGVELSDKDIRAHWGRPIRELLNSLYGNVDLEEAFGRYVKERENYPTSAYEGTLSTLRELAKDYLLGIVTTKSKRYMKDDFDIAGIPEDLFFIIQTEEESKVHKPDPEVFNYVLDHLEKKGIKKSEVLYVGDTLSDYYAARDAGLQFYGIAERTISKSEFEEQGARTITNLSELLTLLKNKNAKKVGTP
jgi:phosphoglycolate phosphatase